jgi:hypothetical protein
LFGIVTDAIVPPDEPQGTTVAKLAIAGVTTRLQLSALSTVPLNVIAPPVFASAPLDVLKLFIIGCGGASTITFLRGAVADPIPFFPVTTNLNAYIVFLVELFLGRVVLYVTLPLLQATDLETPLTAGLTVKIHLVAFLIDADKVTWPPE